jgi:hypothetical protein
MVRILGESQVGHFDRRRASVSFMFVVSYKLEIIFFKAFFRVNILKTLITRPKCEIDGNDKQAIGRVYLYRFPATSSFLALSGRDEFEEFGYDFDLTKRKDYGLVLAVSSLGKKVKLNNRELAFELNLAGQVQVYSVEISDKPTVNLLSVFKSDRAYGAFGSKVQVKS